MAGPTVCGKRWRDILASFERNLGGLVAQNPTCVEEIKLIQAGLITIGQLINDSPRENGNGTAWKEVITRAEAERAVLCKHLEGKALFAAILRLYATTHTELRGSLLPVPEPVEPSEEFREQRRRKRNPSDEQPTVPKKAVTAANSVPKEITTRNFFAPLRATMETDSSGMEAKTEEEAVPQQNCRPPPIILTSSANLIQLQKQLKSVVRGDFEFRSTRNGTRVVTKGMADFEAVKSYFTNNNLSYYSFFPKSQKPIKAVIRHLPPNTPAEDISDGLVNRGFDVISVKQMTSTRRSSSEGETTRNLPLFLITLPRTAKSQEIFKLPSLCHISISVEAYRAQTGLTQCHNCQQFGHVWANCRQPPRCLWCGGGHLHKECPEQGNAASTPACCNCQLAEGEKAHPANYRGCRHAKEELQKRKTQRTPKTTTGRVFSSKVTTPGVSFAAALRGRNEQQQRPLNQDQVAGPSTKDRPSLPAAVPQQKSGQSVEARNVNSEPLDNMLRVVTVVQQIMTELNGAVSEEAKIVAITKIVLSLMKQNGH
jgi:hypothetical protein